MRADAVANRKRVLAAAEEVFGEFGGEASTEEVARRAGVGIGTVFRHFPTKRDLVQAALAAHLAELTARAEELAASGDAAPALHALLREMARTGSTKLSLARHLVDDGDTPDSVGGGSPAVQTAVDGLRDAVDGLLRRAQHDGDVRRDISVDEIYFLLRGIAQAQATVPVADAVRRRAVDVVIDGMAVAPPAPDRPGPGRTAQPGRVSR